MDTVVEVRDEHGGVVTEGEGQVFLGEKDLTVTHTHACRSYFGEVNPCDLCLQVERTECVSWTMRRMLSPGQ